MVDINTESLGLFVPQIDDRSEEQIYRQAQQVVLNRSRGQLNDFSDHNPLGVLLRAQAFTGAELLYRINQLPLAFALKLLELTGATRRLGQKAQVQLTFSLSAPRSVPFVVPRGFEVVDGSGSFSFRTTALLTIPAGQASGIVDAEAAELGSSYNLPAYTINQFTQPLAFLASVVNLSPAQGGAAAETVESAIARGLTALRVRNPVSASDFELQAEQVMGEGSRAKAIGLLGADRITRQAGAVHVFLLSSEGQPANPALANDVFAALSARLMLGTSLYTSPMELLPITGGIIARLLPGADAAIVAADLWQAYQDYLAPRAYEPGEALLIKEVDYALRLVPGLAFLDELTLNDELQNIPMPNLYTLPEAYALRITLTDSDGNIFESLSGAGEPPDFNPAP